MPDGGDGGLGGDGRRGALGTRTSAIVVFVNIVGNGLVNGIAGGGAGLVVMILTAAWDAIDIEHHHGGLVGGVRVVGRSRIKRMRMSSEVILVVLIMVSMPYAITLMVVNGDGGIWRTRNNPGINFFF
jgi:hypothetical protein